MKMSLLRRKRILILALSSYSLDLTRAKEGGEERKARPEKGNRIAQSWQRAGTLSADTLGPWTVL